jgi:putative FmdB family regulatory protein
MPLYEYECDACGHRFEAIRKFSDPPVETCPKCGGHVHKLISAPAFQLKGTGWYATDFAGKGKAPAAASASEGAKGESKDTKDGGTKDSAKDGAKEGAKETTKDAAPAKTETTTSTTEKSTAAPKTNP